MVVGYGVYGGPEVAHCGDLFDVYVRVSVAGIQEIIGICSLLTVI